MLDVYSSLKSLNYFIDNEYLKKYCQLVERHTRTNTRRGQTNKHHIIPKAWFKLQKLSIDNSLTNLVNLPYREHVLAHYYLCLCTEDPFKFANQLALSCLFSRKRLNSVDRKLLESLPMYYYLYEDYVSKLKSNYRLYNKLKEELTDDN